jgi:hypothetical protein
MDQEDVASRQVLEATPERALKFLRAVGTSAQIRAPLVAAGYSSEEHELGWKLLQRASGYLPPDTQPHDDLKVAQAIAELDATDEPALRRIGAALKRFHKKQYKFVFDGLAPTQGAGSILVWVKLLDRLDALESSPKRKKTQKADRAALKTLAKRGYTPEERARVREVIKVAQSADLPPAQPDEAETQHLAEHKKALIELRGWYEDWSETARAVIRRRDSLIKLGLAQRRVSSSGGEEIEDEEGENVETEEAPETDVAEEAGPERPA